MKYVGIEDYPAFVEKMAHTLPHPQLAVVAENDFRRAANFALINAVLGLVGEAAEVSEHIKKHFFNQHLPLDRNKIILELGDLLFYVQLTLNSFAPEMTIEDVVQLNIDKLASRYPERVDTVMEETR